ncbi:uncharacterized protein KIAA1614 homolog [Dasypus novemcinctus]|uniref:uncharacterized protein KIAA1614 homolog n=1 Tax=Dasypus novemcinctus TaxID=9361 RepID=UPI00265F3C35|nr:uncharacterized protein KIAA1614 homolog [Dasypus novemcinctus]
MEGMEEEAVAAAAAKSAAGGPQGPKIVSRAAIPMAVSSAVERSDPKQLLENGHLPKPCSCPQQDRTSSLIAPHPPTAWGVQLQGPSVLESKVRALKEKRTAGKQGVSPGPTPHEQPSPKKSKSRAAKAGGAEAPAEGPSKPGALVGPHAQSPDDSCADEEEPARKHCPRPPRFPVPRAWRSPWPPEATEMLPDHKKGQLPRPGSSQESPVHRVTPSQPGGPGSCNRITHMPKLSKRRSYSPRDGPATGGDPDNMSLVSEEDFVPSMALLGGLWRAGDLGALDTRGSASTLSDQVERNRLLLQEMLRVSGQGPPKPGLLTWTPSWDRAAPERPAGEVDWDSGISLQDSDQNRTFGPQPEPALSPGRGEASHLLQRARVKARTRPLRASHDIVPSVAQGSRDGRRSPAGGPRAPFACRDSPPNGNMSDSSSGESSSGQGPRRGACPSHVRFEDESARDAEFRYLARLQQRQRPGLSPGQQTTGQGPLRSKPELADYVSGGVRPRDAGQGALRGLAGPRARKGLLAPARGGEKRCRACGHCVEGQRPAEGKAPPGPRAPQGLEAACPVEEVLAEPYSSGSPRSLRGVLPERGRHAEWVRERPTRGGPHLDEVDSALDSSGTSDGCRTDSEEAEASQASEARGRPRGCSPRLRGSRPCGRHGGPRKTGRHGGSRKTEPELPSGPQAGGQLSGVDILEEGEEAKEGRAHTREGTVFPREDAVPKPPALESKKAAQGSPQPPAPGLGHHWAPPADSLASRRTACDVASPTKLRPSGSGRQARAIGSHKPLEIASTSSPQQSHTEPSVPHQAQSPTASLSPEGWVPTPPSSRKTTSPASCRKAALARPRWPGDQGSLVDTPVSPSRSGGPRTWEPPPMQTSPCTPQARHQLRPLSTNNCNNSTPQGLQDPQRGATHEGRAERGPGSQEPEPHPEKSSDGGVRGSLCSAAAGTISSTGITLSLASEEPESSQQLERGLQRTELSSGGDMPPRASPGVSAGPSPPSAAPSEKNKKKSSIASSLGLKKFLSALGHGPRPKLGKSHSCSVEQLQSPASGPASYTSTPKVKRAPSLQSLHLVSPSHQHRKAASFQNLHSLLSNKVDRSSLYLVGEPGDHDAGSRPAKALPRRALSVEDVGAPSLARTVGRVVEVFPDGTSQLQLQRSPEGTFGFCVASGNGRRDSGFYVQEMADAGTAKLYSGLLGVGDEILEVNGAKVAGLGLARLRELLAHAQSLSVRVLRQRPVPR